MANPRDQEFVDHRVDQTSDEDFEDSSTIGAVCSSGVETPGIGSAESSGVSRGGGVARCEIGLAERLTNILVEDGDGDLLLQQSERGDRVLQWLQALDMQVMGACRADERLKPMLKVNPSTGLPEDPLLLHLSQHFEPLEVGILARCFCIPLVSIRVGKINKQGTLLCPNAIRGNLNLTLLPSSDLRLTFVQDDGEVEGLITLKSKLQCSAILIDDIEADNTGRSFLIKSPDLRDFYFWCSEKSKFLGIELRVKMKDLIRRKPSISELTGISESRLGCFANHLHAYVMGSHVSNDQANSADGTISFPNTADGLSDLSHGALSSITAKSLRPRNVNGPPVKANSVYQASLSPRSSSFKDGLPRSLSSVRSATREKLRRHGDTNNSVLDTIVSSHNPDVSPPRYAETDKLPEVAKHHTFSPSSFLESLGEFAIPPTLSSHVPSLDAPHFTPYYCLCPTGSSTLQYSSGPPKLPISSIEFTSLPPLSSLLPASRSSTFLTSAPPLDRVDIPLMDFPAFLPDPLVKLPSSQQVPTFTPLMCDPIVHIPVIDVCDSGQGYFVSAGPAISTSIPPLQTLVNPLIPNTDAMVEKGARETLRLLLSASTQSTAELMDALPSMLTTSRENPSSYVTGSRGFYGATRDVGAIANSVAAMGLVTLVSISGSNIGHGCKKHGSYNQLDSELDVPSCSEDKDTGESTTG